MSVEGAPCAVVTGAGSGIGRACALRLAADGARVVLLERDAAASATTRRLVESAGGAATAYEVDVADECAVTEAIRDAKQRYGAPQVLVNCAGIAIRKGLLDTSLEEWQRVIGINLTGYFVVLRAVVPSMRDAGGGSIVQVASIAGHIGYGYPSYTAAKGGVLAMTRQLAGELAPYRIRINSVSPGVVTTGLNRETLADEDIRGTTVGAIPWGRLGSPEDIANVVRFLAGPESDFVTGADLVADGGMISRINWGATGGRLTSFHAKGS